MQEPRKEHTQEGNSSQDKSGGGNSFASADRENPLSAREMEVSQLLVTGATNAEIANALVISPHTVKVHLRNVFEKLDVNSRTEATLVLLQQGWVTVPGVEAAEQTPAESQPEPEPEPAPLPALKATPALWQRVSMLGVVLLLLVLTTGPGILARPKTSFSLLSDAGRTSFGQAAPLSLPRWAARTPLPEPRIRHAAVLAGDEVYVIGGESADGQTLESVTSYDLRFNRWRGVTPMPEPLANLAATLLGDEIFVAGGSASRSSDQAEIAISDRIYALDISSGTWREAGVLPHPLAGANLGAFDGALYLAGGWDGAQMRGEVWRGVLNENSNSVDWEEIAQLKAPAAFAGSVVVDDKMFVIGGYDGQRELAEAATLNLTTDEWRQLPSMSTPRSGLSVVYDGTAVLALGGGWTRTIDTHERFDEAANQWSNFPSPIQGDWRHLGAVASDGHVWMNGGWSGGYLDVHEEYQSSFRALLPVIQSD